MKPNNPTSTKSKLTFEERKTRARESKARYVAKNKLKIRAYVVANKEAVAARKARWSKAYAERIKKQRAEKYAANRESVLAKQRIYQEKRKAEKSEYDRAYRLRNLEKKTIYYAQWCAENKEHLKEYRAATTEERSVRAAAWYEANKEEEKRKNKEYAKTENGRAILANIRHRRRAAKKNCDSRSTAEEIRQFMSSATSCFYCKRTGLKLTLDHFVPLAKGGAHSIENFRAACRSCNSRKKDRDPHAFLMEVTLE